MKIQLWGVRGSCASPTPQGEYTEKLNAILRAAIAKGLSSEDQIDPFIENLPGHLSTISGGNTTCITVTSKSGKQYIVDGGTGIRVLGDEMMKGEAGKGRATVHILFTHFHWDHIQGVPFFKPLYIPGNTVHFYSPYKEQRAYLQAQMNPPFFPATFEGTASSKVFHELDVKNRQSLFLEEDLKVDFYPMKHPGGSFAYRFTQDGKTFIFATDAEYTGEMIERKDMSTDFFMDADIVVLDAQYTLDESFMKIDWGHTSYTMAVNCGLRWNVKKLVLTHHDPSYSDATLYDNLQTAIQHREASGNHDLEIILAREGDTFEL